MEFIRNSNISVEMQDFDLFLLLYADDWILFSESVDGLQSMLHTLSNYSRKRGLQVNVHKTKIVLFRNRGQVKLLKNGCMKTRILI